MADGRKSNECQYVPRYKNDDDKRAKSPSQKVYNILGQNVNFMNYETYESVDPKYIPGEKHFNCYD